MTEVNGKTTQSQKRKPLSRGSISALLGVMCLAVLMHFFRLGQEAYGNFYYAAGVKSMLMSWHNFFFVSFDPAGFVSIDKPPLGLWIQAASAWIFGFHGWSLLLPQALAGVLSVLVLYHLVRRTFGHTAGILAALVLAVTPISVASNRNNTMDSLLVFALLLATWAVFLATERGKSGWLLLAFGGVGLGFNIKMLQAYMILPAFYALYLFGAPGNWKRRVGHLALATVLLVVVSLSWAVVVDLTPADQRPYVGSSQDNSVLELMLGHNGLARLLPFQRLRGQAPGASAGNSPPLNSAPAGQPGPQAGVNGHSWEIGEPGVFRLFNQQLAGQISWLLPLVGLGALAIFLQARLRFPLVDRRHRALLFWVVWLLPQMVFFSFASLFHRYYLEMMAPAIAALCGAGVVTMWRDYRAQCARGWLLSVALLATAVMEVFILRHFPVWQRWLAPLVLALCCIAGLILIVGRRKKHWRYNIAQIAAAVGMLALLIPLFIWAWIPVWYGGDVALPYAGPDLLTSPRTASQKPPDLSADPLLNFLQAQHQSETYLLATPSAQEAAPMILETGMAVMAMGGFNGGDNILKPSDLEEMVHTGQLRFFFLPNQRGPRQHPLYRWAAERCSVVSLELWSSGPPKARATNVQRPGNTPGVGRTPESRMPYQLYDCAVLRVRESLTYRTQAENGR